MTKRRVWATLSLLALTGCTAPEPTTGSLHGWTAGTTLAGDGVSIYYESAGAGPLALVFVHGWSCDRTYWREQMKSFASTHRVVAVDLAGHGKSGWNRKAWSIRAFGDDVAAVVDELALERVVLIGHSLGGPVVVEAALSLEERVHGVVVVDALRNITKATTMDDWKKLAAPLRANFQEKTASWVRDVMFVPTSDPKLVDSIASDMAAAPPEQALAALKALKFWHGEKALEALRVPTLAINAQARFTDAKALEERGVGVVWMRDAGHFLMLEAPKTFDNLLQAALRAFDSRPRS